MFRPVVVNAREGPTEQRSSDGLAAFLRRLAHGRDHAVAGVEHVRGRMTSVAKILFVRFRGQRAQNQLIILLRSARLPEPAQV